MLPGICSRLENVFPTIGYKTYSFMSSFNRFDFTFCIYIFDPYVIYFKITRVGGNSVLIFHLDNCDEE